MEHLLPSDVTVWAAVFLVITSGFASFIGVAVGIGGGLLLISVMATLVPASVLIPLHGVVQFGSNIGRTWVLRRYLKYDVLPAFLIGTLIGAGLGGVIVVRMPSWAIQLGVGLFILWSVWGRIPVFGRLSVLFSGGFSSFLSMFFGSTGPFVAVTIKTLHLDRLQHVGTFSACMLVQHAVKLAVFGLLGFTYGPYLPLTLAMIGSCFIGIAMGKKVLMSMSNDRFHKILNIILILIAIRLIATSIISTNYFNLFIQ